VHPFQKSGTPFLKISDTLSGAARKGYIFITVGHRPAVSEVIPPSLPERQNLIRNPAFQAVDADKVLSAGRVPQVDDLRL
jgi:hypothetical protein